MRTATNHVGYQVEIMTPFGWRVAGFRKPHDTRAEAQTAMEALKAGAPDRELRVYTALESRA